MRIIVFVRSFRGWQRVCHRILKMAEGDRPLEQCLVRLCELFQVKYLKLYQKACLNIVVVLWKHFLVMIAVMMSVVLWFHP